MNGRFTVLLYKYAVLFKGILQNFSDWLLYTIMLYTLYRGEHFNAFLRTQERLGQSITYPVLRAHSYTMDNLGMPGSLQRMCLDRGGSRDARRGPPRHGASMQALHTQDGGRIRIPNPMGVRQIFPTPPCDSHYKFILSKQNSFKFGRMCQIWRIILIQHYK